MSATNRAPGARVKRPSGPTVPDGDGNPMDEREVLTAWAMRFDGWRYCDEGIWEEADRLADQQFGPSAAGVRVTNAAPLRKQGERTGVECNDHSGILGQSAKSLRPEPRFALSAFLSSSHSAARRASSWGSLVMSSRSHSSNSARRLRACSIAMRFCSITYDA